jgi:hypothetical protein
MFYLDDEGAVEEGGPLRITCVNCTAQFYLRLDKISEDGRGGSEKGRDDEASSENSMGQAEAKVD